LLYSVNAGHLVGAFYNTNDLNFIKPMAGPKAKSIPLRERPGMIKNIPTR